MLVLTRKPGETIRIPLDRLRGLIFDEDEIVITLVDSGCGRAKIGIDAPDQVKIFRGEICDE